MKHPTDHQIGPPVSFTPPVSFQTTRADSVKTPRCEGDFVSHKLHYNDDIHAEMFFVNVFHSLVITLLFVVTPGTCFDFVREEHTALEKARPVETDLGKLSVDPGKYIHEKQGISSSHLFESNPFVFRKQRFDENLENIQTMDNGLLMKSTYIPIISNQSNGSDVNEERISDGPAAISDSSVKTGDEMRDQANENLVIKNGKKYRVVKIKKSAKHLHDPHPANEMRRSFKLLSSLSTILPFKWMTKGNKNGTELEKRSENTTQWSRLSSLQNPKDNSNGILNQNVHNSEKIKKLLNLFSIVKFENGECYADGVKGTCLHQMECEAKGGNFAATCAEELGVCCYNEKTCGGTSNDTHVYFINEGFPDSSAAAPKVCTLTLEKTSPDVKQLRLDFEIFQLREPTNGTCLQDRLVISGQDINDVVPDICGANTGQHIYIDVEDSAGPFNLNIITVGEYFPRNFRIKVTQMSKENPLLAPKNCLQYYIESVGIVQTFNYQQVAYDSLDNVLSGYLNNLNYAICIKKLRGFCSVTYENEETDSVQPTFQLVNVDEDGERLLPPNQAGAETFDCPDDYIIVNGIRLCGEKLNDASIEIDYTRNYPVTDKSNGPFILSVRTNAAVNGRGFSLKYRQNPCLT